MSSMIYQNLFGSAIKKPSGTSTNMLIGKIKIHLNDAKPKILLLAENGSLGRQAKLKK